jgi:hypothetical protein
MMFVPLYKIAELVPATRESAKRLGLVTIEQMLGALVAAVENPPPNGRVQLWTWPGFDARAGDGLESKFSRDRIAGRWICLRSRSDETSDHRGSLGDDILPFGPCHRWFDCRQPGG